MGSLSADVLGNRCSVGLENAYVWLGGIRRGTKFQECPYTKLEKSKLIRLERRETTK